MDTLPEGFTVDQFSSGASDIPENNTPTPQSSSTLPAGFTVDSSSSGSKELPAGFQIDPPKDYSTPGQQAATIAEGALGPVAIGGEKILNQFGVPGTSSQDIINRSKTNPNELAVSQAVRNVGVGIGLGLATEGTGFAVEGAPLIQAGKSLLNFAMQGAAQGGITGGLDQVSQWLLGEQHDPVSSAKAVAWDMAGGTIGNMLLGTGANALKYGVNAAGIKDFSKVFSSFLSGMGYGAKNLGNVIPLSEVNELELPVSKDLMDAGLFKLGQNVINKGTGVVGGYGLSQYLPTPAEKIIFNLGNIAAETKGTLDKVIGAAIPNWAKDFASSVFYKMASSGVTDGLDQNIGKAINLGKGNSVIQNGVKALFSEGGKQLSDYASDDTKRQQLLEKLHERFDDYFHTNSDNYAEGGEVIPSISQQHPFKSLYPEYGLAHDIAKGRIMGYLKKNAPDQIKTKLPFDSNYKNPEEDRQYNKLLDLTLQPMSVLKKIKDGSLTPQVANHFISLFPELHQELSNQMNQKIVEHQLNGTPKPAYKMRQALSLFLGTNLDSTLTQPNIMAAQASFVFQPPQQSHGKSSKNSLSKMGELAQTDQQARDARGQKE